MAEIEVQEGTKSGSTMLGGGSLAVAAIEAVCAFFVALSKLGILLAFTSFLSSVIVSRYHADRIRVPLLALAFLGAVVNLGVLWNWRRLRNRPSASWRKRPLEPRQRWRIVLLVAMSTAAIILVVAEFWIHPVRGL